MKVVNLVLHSSPQMHQVIKLEGEGKKANWFHTTIVFRVVCKKPIAVIDVEMDLSDVLV